MLKRLNSSFWVNPDSVVCLIEIEPKLGDVKTIISLSGVNDERVVNEPLVKVLEMLYGDIE